MVVDVAIPWIIDCIIEWKGVTRGRTWADARLDEGAVEVWLGRLYVLVCVQDRWSTWSYNRRARAARRRADASQLES